MTGWGIALPGHFPKVNAYALCKKCKGCGYKFKHGHWKPCKKCVKGQFACAKCLYTGIKIKNGKPCKCGAAKSKGFYKGLF